MHAGVDISIRPHPERPEVRIRGRRPPDLLPLLRERPAEEAPGFVRMILSVCGHAQARACALALGLSHHPAAGLAGAAAVIGEVAREHLLRVLRLKERRKYGEAEPAAIARQIARLPQRAAHAAQENAQALRQMAASLAELLRKRVLGLPPREWRAMRTAAELREWMREGQTPPAIWLYRLWQAGLADAGLAQPRFLAVPGRPEARMAFTGWLYQRLLEPDGEDFAACPHWHGRPCETGALARQHRHPLVADLLQRSQGAGLLTRHVARLLELAEAPARLERLAEEGEPEQDALPAVPGLGLVESPRGLLAHAAATDAAGRVRQWRTLAPTEWNFHPDGVLREGLSDIASRFHRDPARVEALATELVLALDPCVRCRVEVVSSTQDASAATGG